MSRDGFRWPPLPPDFWSQFFPPLPLPLPPPPPPPPSRSSGNLPVLTLSILGVLIAAIFLLAYYFVGAPFCFCRRRPAALGGTRRRLRDNFMMLSMGARGLAASEIRRIPTFQYRKESGAGGGAGDCAVCLGEFQEEETIRLLPGCFHVFHVNCIDTWLQSNANCPLCRATITPAGAATPVPIDRLPAFVRSRGFDRRNHTNDVVIDVKDDEGEVVERRRQLRRHGSVGARRPLPVSGPMRRSFSVGSAAVTDRRLYGEVEKIDRAAKPALPGTAAAAAGGAREGSSGASRIRWGLFSFHRRSSSSPAFN
ncbi:RING-H2 finger protein ATL1-like [Curcuma longa]|uniref:RING-H2 finger protein ATL1-like n=1 Tax=Curcuma longa TaxID=136217 RepID=UPI003D9E6F1D